LNEFEGPAILYKMQPFARGSLTVIYAWLRSQNWHSSKVVATPSRPLGHDQSAEAFALFRRTRRFLGTSIIKYKKMRNIQPKIPDIVPHGSDVCCCAIVCFLK
jgi:hypothetical protein